jgi:hypothetical protein
MEAHGGSVMLQKIETKEIMTKRAAKNKYESKFFIMRFTETIDRGDNDLGYVMYVADSEKELGDVPRSEYKGQPVGFMVGGLAYPYPMTGKVVYHD